MTLAVENAAESETKSGAIKQALMEVTNARAAKSKNWSLFNYKKRR